VRIFSLEGQTKGTLSAEPFKHPRGVASGLGLIAVVDSRRRRIGLYDLRSSSSSEVMNIPLATTHTDADVLSSARPSLTEPYYVELIEQGSGFVAVTDWAAPSLKLYSLSTGGCVSMAGGYGTGLDQMLQPYGLVHIPWERRLLIADHVNHRIQAAPIQLAPSDPCGLGNGVNSEYFVSRAVDDASSYRALGSLQPVADKVTNSIWHPMAIAADERRKRIVVSEALGSIKVFRIAR
ncbi:hypothetical protein FGIG_02930, partial [Fasciola gigantica]